MKKVLFMLAFAGLAMAANAQLILGGQLGFNTTGGKATDETASPTVTVPNTKSMSFTFAPTISYVLNEKMQVGVSLGYGINTTTTYSAMAYAADKEAWIKNSMSFFEIAPYFRYYFANAGNFNFFCEAALGFALTPRTKTHTYSNVTTPTVETDAKGATSTTVLALNIVPGVNYKFSDNWSADCYIDLAGVVLGRIVTKTYGVPGDDNKLADTDVNTVFGFTADASAQDLTSHFGNFRIGFNYHF